MTEPGGFMDGVARSLRQARQEGADRLYFEGYNDAAGVCFEVLQCKINELLGRITADQQLTGSEQYALAALEELKSEMDTALQSAAGRNAEG